MYIPAVPSHRGAARDRYETRGGMRWTRLVPLTNGAGADGEVVWSWTPSAGVDGGYQAWYAGESTKETVKTIARGMPGDFRCDRGDYARVLCFITACEAAGASSARHSLRPLIGG